MFYKLTFLFICLPFPVKLFKQFKNNVDIRKILTKCFSREYPKRNLQYININSLILTYYLALKI